MNLSRKYLQKIVNESINNLLYEAGGALTSKVMASRNAPRNHFNADEVLRRALSCNTLSEIYNDKNLYQMLKSHEIEDGKSYLDYVKEQFAKEGKYRTNKRGTNRINKINWTPETAIEYSSNYLNGYQLALTPEGRSCYHFLKTRGLLDKAFKNARKIDAEKASEMLYNRELMLQQKMQDKAKKKEEQEALRKQRAIDKEAQKQQAKVDKELMKDNKVNSILKFIKDNGIERRAELKRANPNYYNVLYNIPGMLEKVFGDKENSRNINDMNRVKLALQKSDSPSYLRRYSPLTYKRMVDNGTINQYYPQWKQINGIWRKVGE